jgi:hypothetical protein
VNSWRKHTVIWLVVCLMQLSLADVAWSADITVSNPSLTRQRVDQFGVGANLKVQLVDGKIVKGSVVSVGDNGFDLRAKSGDAPRHIAYNNVNEVKLAKLVYRAKGTPDPAEARRVVLGLGVGHHIQVKTSAGMEYHGNIQLIDSDSFTMLPDHQSTSVQITFSDVHYVEQNMGGTTKALIVVGVVVAAVVIALAIVFSQMN